jgi:hypothetical protein
MVKLGTPLNGEVRTSKTGDYDSVIPELSKIKIRVDILNINFYDYPLMLRIIVRSRSISNAAQPWPRIHRIRP